LLKITTIKIISGSMLVQSCKPSHRSQPSTSRRSQPSIKGNQDPRVR